MSCMRNLKCIYQNLELKTFECSPLLPGLTDTEESLASLYHAFHEMGINEIQMDYLNPYPAVVHRMKNIYRRHFPKAIGELEKYLNHPGIYRDEIAGRLYQFKGETI